MTYNPSKSKVHAVLKDQAKSDDILKAAFHVRYIYIYLSCNFIAHLGSSYFEKYIKY